jgi:hypothetical protein
MDEKFRISSTDAFRGFAIICMVIVNYGIGTVKVPGILKHAKDTDNNYDNRFNNNVVNNNTKRRIGEVTTIKCHE